MKPKQTIPLGVELRTIPPYPEHSISECGNYILSAEGNVITQSVQLVKRKPSGYKYATLCSSKLRYYKRVGVHRLVAFAWLPEPPSDKHVWINHKDGNKANNHASNLEWTTISQNIQHKFDTGLHVIPKGKDHWLYGNKASKQTRAKMSAKKMGINHPKFKGYYFANFKRYESANQAAKYLGMQTKTVYNRCHNPNFRLEGWYFVPVDKLK